MQNEGAPGALEAPSPVREAQATHTTSPVVLSKACAHAAPQTHAFELSS